MMAEADELDPPSPDECLDTTDEIGTGEDLQDSREDRPREDLNTSTDAVHSDTEDLHSDDIPEINSKLSLKEEPAVVEDKTNGVEKEPPVRKSSEFAKVTLVQTKPVEIKPVHIGDQKLRSKLKFEVVTAKVVEEQGKKHVTYTVMMKRASEDKHPAVICRRYNDFCYLYERILCTFHPSILGEFQFPKKVLIGNFKAEVITERTDAFHKFLNLIAQNDKVRLPINFPRLVIRYFVFFYIAAVFGIFPRISLQRRTERSRVQHKAGKVSGVDCHLIILICLFSTQVW